MRKCIVWFCLASIFSCIVMLFWYKEWVYNLPTPVPVNYLSVGRGQYIDLAGKFSSVAKKPVFLHFFNPDCPCSHFSVPQFKSLVKEYGREISFAVVAMTQDKEYTIEHVREKFGLAIPVIPDTSPAGTYGICSTPQDVLPGNHHLLYYRGNYHKSRYCTGKKSNYAEIVIDSLLPSAQRPLFSELAPETYGCSLPTCTK
jgi:hypothetical protein